MGRVVPTWIMLVTAAAFYGSACAMSAPMSQSSHCRVVDSDKLSAGSGGASALCAAIERAVSERAPGVAFTAEVRVLSSSRLAATLTRDGKKLPEQKFASMDRELTSSSFERFAQAVADQVAKGRQ
jgi:hypothetical protein